MDLSTQSKALITSFLEKALEKYVAKDDVKLFTDIHLQPKCREGKLIVWNDDDEILLDLIISEWVGYEKDDFYVMAGRVLHNILNSMQESGFLDNLKLVKPYSFVLVDEEKETVSELLLVDDLGTLLLNDELLQGLDDELESFLKDLLES